MREQLIGTWRLVSFEMRRADGRINTPYGPDPLGLLIYDDTGHVAVQMMRRERPAFAANDQARGTPEENQAAVAGYIGYYGAYEVEEGERMVVHHVAGSLFPNWIGGEQRRYYELVGDRLVLSTPPLPYRETTVTSVLTWERVA